jgi:hypothetical protein
MGVEVWGFCVSLGVSAVDLCSSLILSLQSTNLWAPQQGNPRPFLKITCALPNLVTPARSEWGLVVKGGRGDGIREVA